MYERQYFQLKMAYSKKILLIHRYCKYRSLVKFSVADPDPGLGAFLTPGSGIRDGRKSASGSGIQNEQPGSYFKELRNHFFAFFGVKLLKFFDEGPGWRQFGSGIRNGKKSDPG